MTNIKFDAHNYRTHDEKNLKLIKKSLKELGAGRSIVIDSEGEIIAGNATYKQAQELGLPIKVIESDGKSLIVVKRTDLKTQDKKRKKLALADNSTSDKVQWDFDHIAADFDLEELPDWGIEDLPNTSPVQAVEEDDVPEVSETTPRAKKGDIWQLGDNRLMCGDSTVITDVEKLMGGEKADLVLTDPPYGISVVKNKKVGGGGPLHFGSISGNKIVKSTSYRPIEGDNTTNMARLFYSLCTSLGIKNLIFFGGNYFSDFLPPKPCWLVWDKENNGNFADAELAWTSFEKGVKLYKWLWNGLCRKGERKIEGKSRVHPTQKPVGLIANILKDFSSDNEIIFDGFGGSGTTLIACEQLGRKARLMEIDPKYCDVIITRWETLTGKPARLLEA